MVSHKAKTLFHWNLSILQQDTEGASIAQNKDSDAIRKQCKVCTY